MPKWRKLDKIRPRLVYQGAMTQVAPQAKVTAIVRPRYPGRIVSIVFHEGVLNRFLILGFGLNIIQPTDGMNPRHFFEILLPVQDNDAVTLLAQNVSKEPAVFSHQVIMEVDDDVWDAAVGDPDWGATTLIYDPQ